jgi:hypothetical protein
VRFSGSIFTGNPGQKNFRTRIFSHAQKKTVAQQEPAGSTRVPGSSGTHRNRLHPHERPLVCPALVDQRQTPEPFRQYDRSFSLQRISSASRQPFFMRDVSRHSSGRDVPDRNVRNPGYASVYGPRFRMAAGLVSPAGLPIPGFEQIVSLNHNLNLLWWSGITFINDEYDPETDVRLHPVPAIGCT